MSTTENNLLVNDEITRRVFEQAEQRTRQALLSILEDRKLTEQALRENQERLDLALQSAQMGVWYWDIVGDRRHYDDQVCHLLGIDAASFAGKAEEFFRVVHPDDLEGVKTALANTFEQNVPLKYEYRVIWPDGSVHYLATRGKLLCDHTGRAVRINGLSWEITEYKKGEEALVEQAAALRQSNDELARLYRASGTLLSGARQSLPELALKVVQTVEQEFGQANCSLFLIDGATKALNRIAVTGLHRNEAEDKILTLDGPGLVPLAIRSGKLVNVADVHDNPDYVPNWKVARSEMAIPLIVAGSVIGAIDIQSTQAGAFSASDEALMTIFAERAALALQQKQAETALVESEAQYRRLAEELERRVRQRTAEIEATRQRLELATQASELGIWKWDLKTGQLTWDERMFAIYGLSPEEFDGTDQVLMKITHPDDMSIVIKMSDSISQGEKTCQSEYRIIRPNGTVRYIAARGLATNGVDGSTESVVGTIQDITIQKQIEETLRLANAEKERALRMKDEFLANMSHELRTPLNAILGISESLEEQIAGPLNDKQQKYIHTISESGHHLLELINDILDLSKIEAGRLTLDLQKTTVGSLCESSLRMIKELAQKKHLHITYSPDGQVQTVLVDPRRIKQALVNLLSNAVKFTPEGGQIGLKVSGDPQAMQVTFTVWDTGIGIAPENIARLFQPFVQLDSGLSREHSGTGLGLALVAEMVRLHGGRVSVQSTPKLGSQFSIFLPWSPAESKMQKSTPVIDGHSLSIAPSRPMLNAKILLVEDTETVIMIVSDYLQSLGCQVNIARNGFAGVKAARSRRPDLILMDIQMPGMDGFEATRQIRSNPSLQNIPILALTAMAMQGDRERCLAAGMNGYLSKPIQLKELSLAIDHHLRASVGEPA